MAFFCGLMKVMEAAGLCDKLGKLISPLMRLLFPEVPADHPANSAMALYFGDFSGHRWSCLLPHQAPPRLKVDAGLG